MPNVSGGIVLTAGASGNTIGGSSSNLSVCDSTCNLISGNGAQGIHLLNANTDGNLIRGNFIGLNYSGTALVPNGTRGIRIQGAVNTVIGGTSADVGNLTGGGSTAGIDVQFGTGTVIQSNFIGTNIIGSAGLGNGRGILAATAVTIGGNSANARNIISGNSGSGVELSQGGTVQGNYIGLHPNGTAALPNFDGLRLTGLPAFTIGGSAATRNVISGNPGWGISIPTGGANGSVIAANYVGTNAAGTGAVPNGAGGISLITRGAAASPSFEIAIGVAGAGNVISGNAGPRDRLRKSDASREPIRITPHRGQLHRHECRGHVGPSQ